LARRTSASGCLSSQWPTPDAFLSNDGEQPETFLARQEREKAKGINGNGMGVPLAMAAKVWPTPSASETRQGFQRRPDGMASDQNQQSLTTVAMLWATPTAKISEDSQTHRSGKRSEELLLTGQAKALSVQWATPRAKEDGQYQYSRGDKTKPVQTLTGQAFSHLDQETSTLGETSSPERRSLNPLFVEWLMGWPPGWTSFACSATALSAWKARMRSALLQLGSPMPAPPVQLALFA
jgi:hypothetical protein